MKALTIITIIIFGLMFLFCAKHLWKEWKDGRKPNSDDLLHMLNFKIENCMMDDHSEIYLIREIAELKMNPAIDKIKLKTLENKFKDRYAILHPDSPEEHSPESIFG